MKEIFKTSHFDTWLRGLRDRQAVARIQARIDRLAMGNAGDVKAEWVLASQKCELIGARISCLFYNPWSCSDPPVVWWRQKNATARHRKGKKYWQRSGRKNHE